MNNISKVVLLISSLLSSNAIASDWFGDDKIGTNLHNHFVVSTLLVSTTYIGLGMFNYEGDKALTSFSACMAAGVTKEIVDIGGSGFDYKDLTWDAAGCAIGTWGSNYMFSDDVQVYGYDGNYSVNFVWKY